MNKTDYKELKTAIASPDASSMIETFRAIGYSIETAVADVIDNSISASSKNIWVDYNWKGPQTTISITDDGIGMNNEDLIQALRPGSTSPLQERNENDLGRFGLGLKTASFSQTRKFTVISKAENYVPVYWSWDLDFVKKTESWSLVNYCHEKAKWEQIINEHKSGTSVIWWDLDRLTKDTLEESEESKAKFLQTMENVKTHLSMVFHKYIEGGINVFFRERKIKPWDPFMIGKEGLQIRPEATFNNGRITVRGFILPHRSKLTPEEYQEGKGPKDSWTAHQGFYVYRKNRLLVAGDWLGLFKKEVHYDLCRIQIDLPNNFDAEWQIDIKKSVARPPIIFRESIVAIAKDVRAQAIQVYRHRGKTIKRKLSKEDYSPFWEEKVRHGKRFYKINRLHPLIEVVKNELTNDTSTKLDQLLKFIEETVPVPLITLQENENESPHGKPFEGANHDQLIETIKMLYIKFTEQGMNTKRAQARLLNTEPFSFYPEYIQHLGDE